VRRNLPDLPAQNLLGEPEGRDTLNAIGLTAAVLARRDRDAVLAVVTADHVIEPVEVFRQTLRNALSTVGRSPGRWSRSASSRPTATRAWDTSTAARTWAFRHHRC